MSAKLVVTIDAWPDGGSIPAEYALGVPAEKGHVAWGGNRNPAVRWSGAPAGTKSFAILCVDPDAPSRPDNVNKEGMSVPADLPRADFHHWVLVDIPASASGIEAGADSDRVTPHGKPYGPAGSGVRGINDYTGWFAADDAMKGDYGGYDGPCPPWNDEIPHRYRFTVYALDVASLGLSGRFGAGEARRAMEGHVLASGEWVGTYAINPAVRGR